MLCSATSPASFVAMVNGEKTVIKIGASSTRPLRMSRTASSSRPSAPAPGSSGRRRAQSATVFTPCSVQRLAPPGWPW